MSRIAVPVAVVSAIFILIWSTGFIVARYGMPHAPPFKFLVLRFALSVACYLVWARLANAQWPRDRKQWGHLLVTGVMMHALYLGGVWSAVKAGMGAGMTALLVSLQPVLTAVWMSRSGERIGATRWLGLALGFAGLLMVVWQKLHLGEVDSFNITCAIGALLGITAATLYQKRFVQPGDFRTANAVQLSAALIVCLPLAALESESFNWLGAHGGANLELIGAMGWSVLVLTLGGTSLLYTLIQRGVATSVTSLFYLVPACTAMLAWLLFGEPLGALTIGGLLLSALGVALVVRPR